MTRREAAGGVLLVLGGVALSIGLATHTRPMSDEGGMLTAASRLLRGEVFYRDLDAYWFAGCAYLLAFAMDRLGEDLWVARAIAAGSYLSMVVALYGLALRVAGQRLAAGLGVLLLCVKILAWPALTIYLHTDLAFAAACIAVALLLAPGPLSSARRRGAAALGAGLAAGAALLFKHNVGLALGAAAGFVLWRARDRVRSRTFAAGFALVVLPVLAGFTARGLGDELLWSAFGRPLSGYLPTSGVSFLPPLAWWRLGDLVDRAAYQVMPVFMLRLRDALPGDVSALAGIAGEIAVRTLYTAIAVIAVAALGFVRRRHASADPRDRRLVELAILAAAVTASAFPRADFPHVASVAPLVGVLGLGLLRRPLATAPVARRRRARAVGTAALAVVAALSLALAAVHQSRRTHRIDLPRARVHVPPEHAYLETLVRGIDAELDRDARLFVYGQEAHLYFLTDRYYPWPFTQLYPGQEGGDGGAALAARLRTEPPALVVRGFTGRLAELPALPRYAPALDAAIRSRFAPDRRFFARHPLPPGVPRPRPRELAVLRPRPRPDATGASRTAP